jgi:undecaprenyl-diphosphatase
MLKKILKENYKYFIVLFLMMVFFFVLNKINSFEIFKEIDSYVSNLIKSTLGLKYNKLFNFTSDFLGIYTLIFVIVCMLFGFKNKIYVILLSSGYIFTMLFSTVSKVLISRARPLIEVTATIDPYSFPSGHTLISFVSYYFIAYLMSVNLDKKRKIAYYLIATILVTTVAFSRLYLGVHYFTDVMGAILFGTVILSMLINIVEKNFKRKLL